jgi:putative colanic acid biosynthesis UDP-glucose lipid carrier transferase
MDSPVNIPTDLQMIPDTLIAAGDIQPTKPMLVPVVHRCRELIDRKTGYLFLKRILDLIFSFVFILSILSWLLPVLAVLIKLSSRGPVFFRQKRIGFGGRSFTCYKLRTMVVNPEADTRPSSEYDERVTRLGHFLRKTNMDEFPQFLNVLKGDMSIVGPRPHMYADCRLFASLLPGYKFRNMVRPGITGLAQIKGYHGPTEMGSSVMLRFYWDEQYIRHISWALDIRILLLTVVQHFAEVFGHLMNMGPIQRKNSNEIQPG